MSNSTRKPIEVQSKGDAGLLFLSKGIEQQLHVTKTLAMCEINVDQHYVSSSGHTMLYCNSLLFGNNKLGSEGFTAAVQWPSLSPPRSCKECMQLIGCTLHASVLCNDIYVDVHCYRNKSATANIVHWFTGTRPAKSIFAVAGAFCWKSISRLTKQRKCSWSDDSITGCRIKFYV